MDEHEYEQADKTALRRWGDEHQFDAAPMEANYSETTGVLPKVTLVSMTPDPLGAIAAACRMYEGKPTYSLSDITDDERRHYWQQIQKTHLKAPLEYVDLHFFIEGVDRAFTHQMVRQRTAVYAQESMRFAVMGGDFRSNTSLPPSLHGTVRAENAGDLLPGRAQEWRNEWDDALMVVENAYTRLVEGGMPAEEARGLLPHAMATRLNYHTNLRSMLDHAGNRLCTQAQFHWRIVWAQMANEIKNFAANEFARQTGGHPDDIPTPEVEWQFYEISKIFKPVCYQLGHCPFTASFDRSCSIRDRVEENAAHGRSSDEWHLPLLEDTDEDAAPIIDPIHTSEWALDPTAARSTR